MQALPPIFSQWSSTYVLPGLKHVFGVDDINHFYVEAFIAASRSNPDIPAFLSLGCGDGTVEITIAQTLLQRGVTRFRFVCYDLAEILLDRFRKALPADLSTYFELVAGDLNAHVFEAKFDAVMANHSLHHIVDLEGVFRTTFECLTDAGVFVTSDMIGRNGHLRWPEARLFVDFLWPLLTQQQRHNVLLRRDEHAFIDHDCSTVGFEGIRAQDVLPLMLRQGFHPWKFFGFGGMIDVFVDRCFGPGFRVTEPDDLFLIRRLGFLNEVLLDTGLVKPTMMLAYFTKSPRSDNVYYRSRSAEASVRDPEAEPSWLGDVVRDLDRSPVEPDYAFRTRQFAEAPKPSPAEVAADEALALADATSARQLQTASDALHHAEGRYEAAQAIIEQQADYIRALERSSSWRLTAPLRTLVKSLRKS